jgi:hypothetical protein
MLGRVVFWEDGAIADGMHIVTSYMVEIHGQSLGTRGGQPHIIRKGWVLWLLIHSV